MEEILSSIKRIIAEEGEQAVRSAPRGPRRAKADDADAIPLEAVEEPFSITYPVMDDDRDDEILELTDEMEPEPMPDPVTAQSAKKRDATILPLSGDGILSPENATAARLSLSALSALVVKPAEGEDNTLDGLVRAMLRPMLKEWLDSRLPEMVEGMVAQEIARITGRPL